VCGLACGLGAAVEHFGSVAKGLWVGFYVCIGSCAAAMLLALLSWQCPPKRQPRPRSAGSGLKEEEEEQEGGEEIRAAHARHFNASFWLICLLVRARSLAPCSICDVCARRTAASLPRSGVVRTC
jgi:hypothetical protein